MHIYSRSGLPFRLRYILILLASSLATLGHALATHPPRAPKPLPSYELRLLCCSCKKRQDYRPTSLQCPNEECKHLACEERCFRRRNYQAYLKRSILPVTESLYVLSLRKFCEKLVSGSGDLPSLPPGVSGMSFEEDITKLCLTQMRAEESRLRKPKLTKEKWCDIENTLRETLGQNAVGTNATLTESILTLTMRG